MAVCQEQKQNFIVKLLPLKNQPSKHQSIIIRMSYVLLSILLYIIGTHNPKPLDNPQKYQIIFRNPADWGVSEKRPALFCLPPEGVVSPSSRDRQRP